MTRTSGIYAYQVDLDLSCLACDWSGSVEATADEEDNALVWVCPNCTTEHEEELE